MWKLFPQPDTLGIMNDLSPLTFFDLNGYAHANLFTKCTYVWEALANIERYLDAYALGKIEADIPSHAYLIDSELITIGRDSVVEPGAYIQGPCVLGRGCTVRHGAYIRGNVIVGDGCVIGHDTEMKGSVMLNGAHAAHFAYVGDSILGKGVNLGAGTILANLRFDRKPVTVRHGEKLYETGLKKFGAILGDGAQTGCNAVTNPGTLFAKGAICRPCINVGGIVH